MTHFDWNGRLVGYPADRAAHYRASGAWSDAPTGRRLREVAERHPDRPAVISADGRLSYAELDRRTDQLAAGLVRLGLRQHDPVLLQLTNRLDTVVAWYGVIKAGLVPVATLAAHRMHEISYISAKVGATVHIVEAGTPKFDLVEFALEHARGQSQIRQIITVGADSPAAETVRLEDIGVDIDAATARQVVLDLEDLIDPQDVVAFQLSGGTTGVPKVIPRIHAEYWNNGLLYAQRLGWDEDTRVAHLIPLVHNAGISCAVHAAHAVGGCLVVATPDPETAFELMARTETTDVLLGHGLYRAVFDERFVPARKHLRRVILSGAKVPPSLFDHVQADGALAGQLFGMSEGLFTVTPWDAPESARLATVGTVISPEDEIRLLDPGTETPVPHGEVGELCCRGPYTIPGYFDAAEHNAGAFTSDGFYRSGDLAMMVRLHGEDYLSIEGRIKDVINRGGEKINAEEVETLLLRHPGITEAAVVAMPDPRLGERGCAYLVSATGIPLSMSEIQRHLGDLGVAKYKWPEHLEWVEALPRSNVGKVDKKWLRNSVAALVAESESTA
ncbi:(2,3-dihydroxybenzoyl)adenylate synthase [Nocardia sp. NPDC056100]|uniref:(2,3-dihydroxybenzoyl)adenylate synthase n=1 Tax=Nocardia sp. NPDC056100 TaxID=3345712 RepID=UPI0035E20856